MGNSPTCGEVNQLDCPPPPNENAGRGVVENGPIDRAKWDDYRLSPCTVTLPRAALCLSATMSRVLLVRGGSVYLLHNGFVLVASSQGNEALQR